MRTLAFLLAGLVLAAACGGERTKADQDKDGKVVADAIRSADSGGTRFSMDETLVLSGGDIPKGQQATIHAQASGLAKDGNVEMVYKIVGAKQNPSFDMLIVDDQLYVRPHGSSEWKTLPATAATALFAAVRLPLLRESVLLARSVSGSTLANTDGGFVHKYAVKPASDQLEQLQSVPVQGSAETAFLKTAGAEVDAFLSLRGNQVSRLEVHLTGTDPGSGTKQKIDSTINLKAAAVKDIQAPASAIPIDPTQILAGT